MVLKLADSMDISPADVNIALVKAGFAPAYAQAELNDNNVQLLRKAMDSMLENHMPWPAIVCDRQWELVSANPAALHLMEMLGAVGKSNVMQTILDADDIDGPFSNWPEVAYLMLRRLNAEQLERPDDKILQGIRAQLVAHPRLMDYVIEDDDVLSVVVPVNIRFQDQELSLISMLAQFGAVQEVTYSGIHIEMFFPADTVTEDYFENQFKETVNNLC